LTNENPEIGDTPQKKDVYLKVMPSSMLLARWVRVKESYNVSIAYHCQVGIKC
jgi:hypothetical protein